MIQEAVDYAALGRKTRRDIAQTLFDGGRGHLGAAFSLVEILLVLYKTILKVEPKNPAWPDRDRLILSKGHGCLALYAVLSDAGFFSKDELKRFCKPDGILGGHPEHHKVPGVEASTGALGHGLSLGVGMALAARMDGRRYRTFVIVGDGECNEGSIWEAAMSASKHRLEDLFVLVDYNKQQSYGKVSEVLPLEPFADKWRAFGFQTEEIDMDRPLDLQKALERPNTSGRPRALICHTIKGKGVSFTEGNLKWHHKVKVSEEELAKILKELEPS